MTDIQDLQETFRFLKTVVRPVAWRTPVDLPAIRQDLIRRAHRSSSNEGPSALWEYDYPDLDRVPAAAEACEIALNHVAAELHEHELWALRTVLGEARAAASYAKDHTAHTVTERSIQSHGLPTRDEIAEAYRVLDSSVEEQPDEVMTDEQVAEAMKAALARLDINGWTVEIAEKKVSDMSVNGGRHRVEVLKGARFSPGAVAQLLVHEIGTHVLRRHCAERQPSYPLRLAPGSATRTEEGLAVWRENQAHVNYPARDRIYAARVIAVDLALRTGITEVIDALTEHVSIDMAVSIAIRVKRGLANPHEPGAYVKDHVYFSGSRMIDTHLSQYPDDLSFLFATKWPLEALWRVRDLVTAGLVRPVPAELTDPRIVL